MMWSVNVVEEVVRRVHVEASSAEEAGEMAILAVVNSDEEENFLNVRDRYVDHVEIKKEGT